MITFTLKFDISETSEPDTLKAVVEFLTNSHNTPPWTKTFTLVLSQDGFYRAKNEKLLDEAFHIHSGGGWDLVALGDKTTFQKDDSKKLFRHPDPPNYFRNDVRFNFKGPKDRFTILEIRTLPFSAGPIKTADFVFNLKWEDGSVICWDPQMEIGPTGG